VLHKQEDAGWRLLRGNHEDYVLRCGLPGVPTSGPLYEINQFAYFAHEQLNGEIEKIKEMPERYTWIAPDGGEFRVVHASMEDNRDGIYKELPDEDLRAKIEPAPAVFVTGHTHQPLIRDIDQTLVVNTGSVGSPFDLDWRPSYGRFSWDADTAWQAEIRRVPYDRQLIERDYTRSGFLVDGGPLAQIMLVELRRSRGLIYHWATQYEQKVINEEISLEESVKRVLKEDEIRPYLGPPGWTF
jgi:predicted phosphodiesterase